jgi:thiaminase
MSSLLSSWSLDTPLNRASIETPFIATLVAGLLPAENFNRWLVNDYVYVHCGAFFLARLITSLPQSEEASELGETLRGGYKVLLQELNIFRAKAKDRGVVLPEVPPVHSNPEEEAKNVPEDVYKRLATLPGVDPGCREYMHFMTSSLQEGWHWTTLLAALWMLELVYYKAMWAVKTGEGFKRLDDSTRDFVEWWSNEDFRGYVETLGDAVDRVKDSEGWREGEVRQALDGVLAGEMAFWGIAEEGLQDMEIRSAN